MNILKEPRIEVNRSKWEADCLKLGRLEVRCDFLQRDNEALHQKLIVAEDRASKLLTIPEATVGLFLEITRGRDRKIIVRFERSTMKLSEVAEQSLEDYHEVVAQILAVGKIPPDNCWTCFVNRKPEGCDRCEYCEDHDCQLDCMESQAAYREAKAETRAEQQMEMAS